MTQSEVDIPTLLGWRAEVGMLAPDPGMFREYDIVAPAGVRFSTAILGLERTTPEALKDMARHVEVEAKKLNIGRQSDLICFGCTSGSFIGGPGYDQSIIERIEKASGSPATTTTTCVLELLKDMGFKQIALVGPYTDLVFDREIEFFKSHGIEALYVRGTGLNLVEESEFWDYMMNPSVSYKLAREGARAWPEADCVFITCMSTSILGVVDILEREIGKPVISSCSATLYGMLKKLGIPDPVYHYGDVLTRPRVSFQA